MSVRIGGEVGRDGRTRLWQQDFGAAASPPAADGNGLWCVASAWLDNRAELARALDAPPELADADLTLRAYRRWGAECPRHLLGDFAFAIWDEGQRRLFCARDPIGARPFFYHHAPGARFVFASDIDSVLAVPGVPATLDEPMLAAYLLTADGLLPAYREQTFRQAVRKLPPGCRLTVGADVFRLDAYHRWEDAPAVRLRDDAAYEDALRERVSRAVDRCVHPAWPVGSHVSGGLDSSTVTALAARRLQAQGRRLTAFAWQSAPSAAQQAEQEYRRIEAVCAPEQTPCHYVAPTADDLCALALSDFTRWPTHMQAHEAPIQRAAAALGIRVLLSGWGGDEVASSAGSGWALDLWRAGRWRTLAREGWRMAERTGRHPLRLLASHLLGPLVGYYGLRRWWRPYGGAPWRALPFVDADFARRCAQEERLRPRPLARHRGVRAAQLARLALGHLSLRMEAWAIAGARHGITYRYPLLDRAVVEFALGLPPEQFIRDGWNRSLFRRALGPLLPPEVRDNRNKRDPGRIDRFLAARQEALTRLLALLRQRPPASPWPWLDGAALLDWVGAGQADGLTPTKRQRIEMCALEVAALAHANDAAQPI